MKLKLSLALLFLLGLVFNPLAIADDDDDDDDDTMTVVDRSDNADKIIVLPDDASATARENAAFGLETANSARENGREFGRQMSEAAQAGTVSEQVRDGFVEEQRGRSQAEEGKSHRPGGS